MTLSEFLHHYKDLNRPHLKRLIADHLGLTQEFLMAHPNFEIPESQAESLRLKANEFRQGAPLSRILGYREFWSLKFQLSKDTLDPRQDSETLIEAVLDHKSDRQAPLRILDLGTGTGCLMISLLKEYPQASGVAVDYNEGALKIAEKNAEAHQVSDRLILHHGSWFKGVTSAFDVIISNPPYIARDEYKDLDFIVKNYDPIGALTSGDRGLEAYEVIIPQAPDFLTQNGILVLEIGSTQKDDVLKILQDAGFQQPCVYQDLAHKDRCVVVEQN